MNNWFPTTWIAGALLFAACAGCSHKTDGKTELEKAAAEMAKPEPAQAAPAPVVQSRSPEAPAPAAPAAAAPASQQMNQALVSYKAGNLEDAVTRLQQLRASPAMTPQQRMALNDAMGAVMSEIYALAAKGDGRAIAAVKQYEYMQTHR
jgi:hypothetical protein